MAKRGYKLQEFVAHSGTVNCLKVGKKACRQFITGGDDHKVNLWTIGKPTSLMSLSGHSSPVESLAFDSAEVLVLAGASNGAIKLWDLEEAKMVRTLTGHRSSCTAVEFHPFGEFFASGSMDTNLRIWDIRKKGCIHTYKGHSQGVSTIKFTPDGRWVVSGGFDNVVKVWDLTAGKLLHDFTFHEGHIRSIDFHPLEFLLATGSADRTVKFWDLETFELIGSARCEATGVRSIAFHPDGRTLFTGLEDSLKVYSWEPVICHDSVDMGWTTLGDLCIHDGKLLGCSYYQNSVGIWVADISLIEPYSAALEPKKNEGTEQKLNLQGSQLEKVEAGLHSTSPDSESKEIKNIYIDSSGGKPVALKRSGSYSSPKVDIPEDCKEINNLGAGKQNPDTGHTKSNGQALKKSFILPNVVPRDTVDVKDSAKPGKETITFSRTKPGMLLKPAHVRRASTGRFDVDRFSADADSGNFGNTTSKLDNAKDPKLPLKLGSVEESCEDKYPIKSITDKPTKSLSPPNRLFEQEKCDESSPRNKETSPVKYINGVAVVRGRTRSLVERFERKEKAQINKEQTDASAAMICETRERVHVNESQTNAPISTVFERKEKVQINKDQTDASPAMICERGERVHTNENQTNAPFSTVFERREKVQIKKDQTDASPAMIRERRERVHVNENKTNAPFSTVFERREKVQMKKDQTDASPAMICERREKVHVNENQTNAPLSSTVFERREQIHINEDRNNTSPILFTISENDKPATIQEVEPQISERESKCANEGEIIEGLMQTHDVTLSNLRSRLTKLQVVRHFWERRDFKGAINALRKLPDHSVQADVISALVEKMEILTLDLFSYLLPVLTGLLDSKIERHVKISLDMLLKLVAVFGPTIHATTSAPPSVGVDLHAEQRRECCNQCFLQLQKIQKILPLLIRRGDILGKSAQELNLVFQQSY